MRLSLSAIKLPTPRSLKEPRMLVQLGLGLLLTANLIATAFAFHLVGASPDSLKQQLSIARTQLQAEQNKLKRSRMLTANIDQGKTESEKFLATYFTSRR